MLSSGNFVFPAILPHSLAEVRSDLWKDGSRLRVTGICSVQFDAQSSVLKDGVAVPKSFRILMRSPADVVMVRRPSWWTPAHAVLLLALALCGTLGVLAWVVALRRRIRESEQRFRHLAQHDALTGLASRRVLEDRLNVAFEIAKRHRENLAVLMVDLDNFKEINDRYGHHAGDEVLRVTAKRLLSAVRKSDTVARIGGDEFVILLPGFGSAHGPEFIAVKLVESLAEPVHCDGHSVPVSASIGICVSSGATLEADELLKNADAALYDAKESGRNCYAVFSSHTTGGRVAVHQ
jgi:diguanylate cyclase (GGDEF)-like protein